VLLDESIPRLTGGFFLDKSQHAEDKAQGPYHA